VRVGGLAGSIALGTTVGWSMSCIGAVAPDVSRDYGISIAAVGLLTMVVFLVHTIMQIPSGRTIDRFGPKRIGLVGLGLIFAVNALPLIAAEPWLAFVMRTLLGIGTGFAFVGGVEYGRQTSSSPWTLGMFGASTGLGGGLSVAIVPQVEHLVHWRAPWLTAALLAVVAIGVLLAGPADKPLGRNAPRPAGAAGAVLRDRRVWRVGLMMAGPAGMSIILGTWIVTLLVEAGGYSTRAAGLIGSLVMIAGIVTRPLSGWVMRVHPHRMRAVVIGSSVAGALGTVAVAEARLLPLAIVGSIMIGLCSGLPFAYGYVTAARLRPDGPAVAAAMVNACGLVLIVSGIPLIGLTFSLPLDGRIGFFAAAAVWAASLAFLPPRHEDEPEGELAAAPAPSPEAAAPR
jgi:MFS family permease